MAEPSSPTAAVFLSYAREDAEAAGRLADALRAFGLEVWASPNERQGDAWEQQIRTCARFLPIISASTQAHPEGQFRREWQLAAGRARSQPGGVPFLLPIIIDGTPESAAAMPEEFHRAQVTRLPQGAPTTQFVELVKRTLKPANPSAASAKVAEIDRGPERARAARRKRLTWSVLAVLLLAAGGWWFFKLREAPGDAPLIVLMDTTYADRVYDPATLKGGGSNADDIAGLLQDLPVVLVKETTSAGWRREAEVTRLHPALVIIHRSAFYTFPAASADELYPLADNKLVAWMGYLAAQNPRTRFIVYSRHSWEVEAVAGKWREDAIRRFPQLAGKIETWRVPLDRATFRNPLTALELHKAVERTLGVQPKPAAP